MDFDVEQAEVKKVIRIKKVIVLNIFILSNFFLNEWSANACSQRFSIADGGEIEFPPPGQPLPGFDLKSKIKTKSQITNLQPEPKLKSELLPIAPTSSPTIGNTFVGSSFFSR